ncbi:MAG: ring-cleaving dioxygenase [Saprospiraceae bacterium]|nr:ring-cleaving dioxygenase [Saprospiraceae bacterium]
MENNILGLHHITAIAGNAKRNFDFYTKVMGLRLVKKTVNFDDPGTYHFYFGDELGTPGTILTFFPWEGMQTGKSGTGMATDLGYSIPIGGLDLWKSHFEKNKVRVTASGKRFNQPFISIQDPDGLSLTLIENNDTRQPWTTSEVKAEFATRGFHSIALTLKNIEATAKVLTEVLGYQLENDEGNRYRYGNDIINHASKVDLISAPQERPAVNAGGTIHHLAFRVKDEATLMEYREKIEKYGLGVTPKIDRNYFFSIYFREPGGVLFEIATDNPGFSVDEPINELGQHLKLPAQYEAQRAKIEQVLPII